MPYILQVDFKHDGPFGEEMVNAFSDLANIVTKRFWFVAILLLHRAVRNLLHQLLT